MILSLSRLPIEVPMISERFGMKRPTVVNGVTNLTNVRQVSFNESMKCHAKSRYKSPQIYSAALEVVYHCDFIA